MKIYATDIDENALARARQATFTLDALKVDAETSTPHRYFEQGPLGVLVPRATCVGR